MAGGGVTSGVGVVDGAVRVGAAVAGGPWWAMIADAGREAPGRAAGTGAEQPVTDTSPASTPAVHRLSLMFPPIDETSPCHRRRWTTRKNDRCHRPEWMP